MVPYSGLFPWGAANFHYFRGSPGFHEIFHPRNFPHTVALSTHAQIWTGDVLLCLFFATCSALGPPSPLSQAVLAEEVNREVQKAEGRSGTKRK